MLRNALLAVALLLTFGATAQADTFTLTAFDSGWYDNTGEHFAGNQNYAVGRGPTGPVFRNFLAFNVQGLSNFQSATLRLYNPAGQSGGGTATFTLYAVSTTPADLLASHTGRTDIFADLGSGVVLGSITLDLSISDNIVSIDLNADALAALNNSGGTFILGGSLGDDPPGFLFFGTGNPLDIRELVVEASGAPVPPAPVPEPTSMLLLGAGLTGAAALRRRRKGR